MPLFLLAALLGADQVEPTLGALDGRSPQEAGEILLTGRNHGPVESTEVVPVGGAVPPGWTELDLVERATMFPGGCLRRRWVMNGVRGPDQPDNATRLDVSYSVDEIALAAADGCPSGQFVRLENDLQPRDALAALKYLDRVRDGRATISLSCSDKTQSHLCRSRASVMQALRRGIVGYASREGRAIELTLTGGNEPFTTVRYSTLRPSRLRVERAYPAPF